MCPLNVGGMWFSQYGASWHTSDETIELFKSRFNERIIFRNGSVNWPRSHGAYMGEVEFESLLV